MPSKHIAAQVPVDRHHRLIEWFRELRLPLQRFIAGRRGIRTADLDDVAQEVFLRLLRYEREELVADPRGYLFKMAANVASEWSMRASERLPHESGWLDELMDERDTTADLDKDRRHADVRHALQALPVREREILRLHFGDGLDYEMIAAQLGVTRRIVKRDVVRAYTRLRLALSSAETPAAAVPTDADISVTKGRKP